jgi:predicted TIM-barrel fold metal-dependent hydrolase
MEFIDAYAHCGISKYKPLPELERAMKQAGVNRAVLVQHLGEFDNTYIQEVVTRNPEKFAGVCLVDHTKDTACNELGRWADTGRFCGVRLLLESLESNRALWLEALNFRLNIVVFDPEGVAGRLGLLLDFLKENPEAVVILSHMGIPNTKKDPELIRYRTIFGLSQYSNVYFQISGMKMFSPYPYEDLWPAINQALESFGTDRIMWGGNYPVVGKDEDYVREVDLVRSGGLPIPRSLIDKVTCTTAMRVWFS